jgi:hypothetical protein
MDIAKKPTAAERRKEKISCDVCNVTIQRSSMRAHLKSSTHTTNLEQAELAAALLAEHARKYGKQQ